MLSKMPPRSRSPPLPTFGIRALAGPSKPPGLVSISRSQYDNTIKSQPDAKLLYLDDDDGELITVGSSLELSQRLEEPVPRYGEGNITETRHPCDGQLVHVFDIKHSSGSLAEWRDHEAYSSKSLRPPSRSPLRSPSIDYASPATTHYTSYPPLDPPHSAPVEPLRARLSPVSVDEFKKDGEDATTGADVLRSTETLDILGGIEEHLNGLASVLQFAATTLQKAAHKTRETDTTVVEEILQGVKGILTEVGSFGLEAFKELGIEAPALPREVEHQIPTETTVPDSDEKPSSRVKFAFVDDDASDETPASAVSISPNPIIRDGEQSADKSKGKGKSLAREMSILDDSSDDADFLARYPPLRSIRRARSTIETGRHISPDTDCSRFFTRGRRDYEPAVERANAAAAARAQAISVIDATKETPITGSERGRLSVSQPQPDNVAKPENTENIRKPLPGAWPDLKNEFTPTQPTATESSGAFFNRMIGRHPRSAQCSAGIYRANTTASSNPASRLSGPFDPGFPYDPFSASSFRAMRSHPYRAYRRSASPSRLLNERLEAASARRVEQMKNMPKLDTKSSMPCLPRARGGFGLGAPSFTSNAAPNPIGYSKFESHRGVRHHRSVPQFNHAMPPPPAPPVQPGLARRSDARPRFGDAVSSRPDFLSGPSPSNPPPIPFTARPAFVPQLPQTGTFGSLRTGANLLPDEVTAQNTPAVPAALSSPRNMTNSHMSSPSTISLPSAREESASYWRFDPPPTQHRPARNMTTAATIVPEKNKFDVCVEQLKMCGFGCDDSNLRDRLHVYAVAADGDVTEAVEMIEEDRRLSHSFD